jgi:hypothetical protein
MDLDAWENVHIKLASRCDQVWTSEHTQQSHVGLTGPYSISDRSEDRISEFTRLVRSLSLSLLKTEPLICELGALLRLY